MIQFKNGSYIKVIDAPDNKRGRRHKPDMNDIENDIEWFCKFYGFELYPYQKFYLWLKFRRDIRCMRNRVQQIAEKVREHEIGETVENRCLHGMQKPNSNKQMFRAPE